MPGLPASKDIIPPPPPQPPVFNEPPSSQPSVINIVSDWIETNDSSQCFSELWESMGSRFFTEFPERHSFTFIKGYQQIGPTCGLAALWMIAKHLNVDISSQEIFDLATEMRMTTFGEMFSARDLCQLSQEVLGSKADVSLANGDLNRRIPEVLFENCLILIPYDADKNNEPCLLEGRKAHWAILCGIITYDRANITSVIARQSKSRLFSFWDLQPLINSNANLRRPDEKLRPASIVPSEGLAESLANQFIIIKKK